MSFRDDDPMLPRRDARYVTCWRCGAVHRDDFGHECASRRPRGPSLWKVAGTVLGAAMVPLVFIALVVGVLTLFSLWRNGGSQ